jgi:hypothetical protein
MGSIYSLRPSVKLALSPIKVALADMDLVFVMEA